MTRLVALSIVVSLVGLSAGCGESGCPAGSREEGGRCISDLDAGPDGGGEDACTPGTRYADDDGDGHGDPARPLETCGAQPLTAESDDDCDDTLDTVHPGAPETCDGVDEDCDGSFDEGAGERMTYFVDADDDGHGARGGAPVEACMAPARHASTDDDCDDARASVHPGAEETCDGSDENCDGSADEGLQGLVGTPREVLGFGAVAERAPHAVALGDGYAVVYVAHTSAPVQGVLASRLSATEALVGTPAVLSTAGGSYYQHLVPVSELRAIALYTAPAASERALLARTVDFAMDPPALGPEVEVARANGFFEETAAVIAGGRLVVLYEPLATQVAGRSFALDLTDGTTPVTLYTFGVEALQLAPPSTGTTASVLYSAQRPGDSMAHVYLDRLVPAPLSVEGRVFRVSDGHALALGSLAVGPDDAAGATVVYGDFTGELVRLTVGAFGSDPTVEGRTPLELRGVRGATALPASERSAAGFDSAFGVSPSSPPEALNWQHVSAGGEAGATSSFGGAAYIPGVSIARRSSQRGALFWVATATADTRQQLLVQEIGCE
jgi:hypothetical protein